MKKKKPCSGERNVKLMGDRKSAGGETDGDAFAEWKLPADLATVPLS